MAQKQEKIEKKTSLRVKGSLGRKSDDDVPHRLRPTLKSPNGWLSIVWPVALFSLHRLPAILNSYVKQLGSLKHPSRQASSVVTVVR